MYEFVSTRHSTVTTCVLDHADFPGQFSRGCPSIVNHNMSIDKESELLECKGIYLPDQPRAARGRATPRAAGVRAGARETLPPDSPAPPAPYQSPRLSDPHSSSLHPQPPHSQPQHPLTPYSQQYPCPAGGSPSPRRRSPVPRPQSRGVSSRTSTVIIAWAS